MEQPEVCVSIPLNEEEQKEINELMKDYNEGEMFMIGGFRL